MSRSVDITPKQRRILLDLFKKHLPDTIVWAYGSRVKWTSNPYSDLDVVVFSKPEQAEQVYDLREAFDESDLPFRVDLFVWDEVPDKFRKNINAEHAVLVEVSVAVKQWKDMLFSDAVDVNPKVKMKKGECYPFVDMKSIDPSWRDVIESEYRVFTSGGSKFEPYDTLLARITPCLENGKIVRYVPSNELDSPAFGSTEFIVIRGRQGVTENSFAYYLTRWQDFRKFAISQMTGSSGRQRVPVNALCKFNVSIPPMCQQRFIAHVLGSFDDKIELNRKMNETLEAIAQLLFKDWFVDFGPTRAKMAGQEPYFPPDIWNLFPDKLNHADVPDGWEMTSAGEMIEILDNKRIPLSNRDREICQGRFPYYGATSVLSG